MTRCVQCKQQCEYSGPYPELFAICSDCKQSNLQRISRPVGRPRAHNPYKTGQRIPNTFLTASEPEQDLWACDCGSNVVLTQSQLTNRTSCGKCRACFFCKQRTQHNFKALWVCDSCKQQLMIWLNDYNAAGISPML